MNFLRKLFRTQFILKWNGGYSILIVADKGTQLEWHTVSPWLKVLNYTGPEPKIIQMKEE